MPNNIDMSNDLEIWWDRGVENKAGDDLISRINLLVFCLFSIIIIIKINYQ
jgi:hypothetical protein